MSTWKLCIGSAAGAILLGGCAFNNGYVHEERAARVFHEYQRQVEADAANAEPREIELLAADSLGRRMERAHRARNAE